MNYRIAACLAASVSFLLLPAGCSEQAASTVHSHAKTTANTKESAAPTEEPRLTMHSGTALAFSGAEAESGEAAGAFPLAGESKKKIARNAPVPLLFRGNTLYCEGLLTKNDVVFFDLYALNLNDRAAREIVATNPNNYVYQSGTPLGGRYIFKAPCNAAETGGIAVEWRKIDCESGEVEAVYSGPVDSIYATMCSADDGDTIYLMADGVEGADSMVQLLRYRLSTGRCEEIYRSEPYDAQKDFAGKRPQVFDCYGDQLYLLQLQQAGGHTQASMLVLDRDGTAIREFELPGLDRYGGWNSDPVDLTVTEGMLFVRYYDPQDLPPMAFLSSDGERVENADNFLNYPCRLLTKHRYQGSWLLFSTYPDKGDFQVGQYSNQMIFVNCESGELRPAKIGTKTKLETEDFVFANEDGDILLTNGTGNNLQWQRYSAAYAEKILARS